MRTELRRKIRILRDQAQASYVAGPRTAISLWCVKTPPLFYVVKGVPPLSPTSFEVLPLFPPEKWLGEKTGFIEKGAGLYPPARRLTYTS